MNWKVVGLALLLFSGVGAFVSNIAALFGAGRRFTLVLVPVCVVSSLVVGAIISRRLKSKYGDTVLPYDGELPPQYDTERMRALAYRGLSKEQRFRIFAAAMWWVVIFLAADLIVHFARLRLFPNVWPEVALPIEASISMAIAALFSVTIYQRDKSRKLSGKD